MALETRRPLWFEVFGYAPKSFFALEATSKQLRSTLTSDIAYAQMFAASVCTTQNSDTGTELSEVKAMLKAVLLDKLVYFRTDWNVTEIQITDVCSFAPTATKFNSKNFWSVQPTSWCKYKYADTYVLGGGFQFGLMDCLIHSSKVTIFDVKNNVILAELPEW
jgi:hypothetical protein